MSIKLPVYSRRPMRFFLYISQPKNTTQNQHTSNDRLQPGILISTTRLNTSESYNYGPMSENRGRDY